LVAIFKISSSDDVFDRAVKVAVGATVVFGQKWKVSNDKLLNGAGVEAEKAGCPKEDTDRSKAAKASCREFMLLF
jgi:hypothetical protein